jgi:hypothetical protein
LKALTHDESVVAKALEASSVVAVADGKIRSSNIKATGRSTIILREIPSDTPEEEVREIFNFENCKPIREMRSDIGDTWYSSSYACIYYAYIVSFLSHITYYFRFVILESEEDAKDLALDLQMKKRTFRGKAVKARVKSENLLKSYYTVSPVPIFPNAQMPFPPYMNQGIPPMPMNFGGYVNSPIVAPLSNISSSQIPSDFDGSSFANDAAISGGQVSPKSQTHNSNPNDTKRMANSSNFAGISNSFSVSEKSQNLMDGAIGSKQAHGSRGSKDQKVLLDF